MVSQNDFVNLCYLSSRLVKKIDYIWKFVKLCAIVLPKTSRMQFSSQGITFVDC